jgi:hypothetical protein
MSNDSFRKSKKSSLRAALVLDYHYTRREREIITNRMKRTRIAPVEVKPPAYVIVCFLLWFVVSMLHDSIWVKDVKGVGVYTDRGK